MKFYIRTVNAAGHIYACVGLAQAIVARGHTVVFLIEKTHVGQVEKLGFEAIGLEGENLASDKEENQNKAVDANDDQPKEHPFKAMGKMLIESGMLANKTPLEKMAAFDINKGNDFFDKVTNECINFNDPIAEILKTQKPDAVIVDNFLIEPSIVLSGIPYVWLFSGNPLMALRQDELPPGGSGLPSVGNEEEKAKFRELIKNTSDLLFEKNFQKMWQKITGGPAPEGVDFHIASSPYLNIYGYPEELDYKDIVKPPKNVISVDAFVRTVPDKFELPAEFKAKIKPGDKLIYFSMGSMGSANTDMVNRVLELVADSPHKFIVSTGPLHEDVKLPENAWGQAFLPQTKVLALVDLVITHGGNNTVTESFAMGKPMIVMPLFGDQWDNATRVQETGFGVRMNQFECTKEELNGAIEKLLHDEELAKRLKAAADRIATSNSKEKAVIELEKLVEKHRK